MKRSSTFNDIIHVTISNFISLISSVLNGFIIPIILGTLDYGYYKIFTLYASYTILFHFGFNDGILLFYGGKSFNNLNKFYFRSNSIFFIWFQFILSIIISTMSIFATSYFYKVLFILLGINSFFQNLLSYYQSLSQAIMRFTEYSFVNTIRFLFFIFSVLSILLYCKLCNLHHISYILYIIVIVLINSIFVLWYLFKYREITFGKHARIITQFSRFKKYFISGAYMTFGYGVSVLIFNLDSQFVVKFFSVRTYGMYAFAYSMISAGLTILESAAFVLLPHLKQQSKNQILKEYNEDITYIFLLVYFAIIGYFILKIIIYKFIYEYYESLIYFRILLPGMVITCCVSIVISNYYYVLNKGKFYFWLSTFVLIISFFLDSITYILFKNTVALAYSSTISLIAWYTFSNYFMVKWYHIKWLKNYIYMIIMLILFLLISNINNIFVGIGVYFVAYVVLSYVLFREKILKLLNDILYTF